jgi:hypothetical protein
VKQSRIEEDRSMKIGSLRTALLGSTAAAMLIASAGTASAIEYNFGSVQVFFDTTLSAGVSMRTAGTNRAYLPTSNGGPLTGTLDGAILGAPLQIPTGTLPTNSTFQNGNLFGMNTWASQLAGSINTDDGRLNFDKGDLTSNVYKMSNDIQVKWENFTFFSRLNSYYDAVLDQDSSYARSNLVQGQADAVRDVRVLDFNVTGNFDVGGLPLTVRAGKQVINWGEGTFLLNGVNGAMPIDVGAFRRPGAEVKEGLLPIWALDASIGLPGNLSLEAFYQFKQETYQLDRPGTPFSTSDVVSKGSGIGGNFDAVSFLTGSPGGNMMRNCSNPSAVSDAFDAAWAASGSALAPLRDCAVGAVDYTQYNPTLANLGGWTAISGGSTEAFRLAYGDTSIVARDRDRPASDSGQYGIAARWYSEALNNTEFGFYFTNTHSRLPLASERISVDPSTATVSSYLLTSGTTGQQARLLQYNGCNAGAGPAGVISQPGALYGVPLGLSTAALDSLNQAVTDPDGIYAAGLTIAENFYANVGPHPVVNAPVGSPFAGGIEGFNLAALAAFNPNFATMANPVIQANSLLALTIANCALVAEQSVSVAPGAAPYMLVDGAEIMLASDPTTPGIGLYLEYPEDIRMYGFSFNTTLGTWGVQGDVTYRPNQPVQLDTDQITINALHRGCVFQQLVGHTTTQAFIPLDTYGPGCGSMGVGANSADLRGYERTKIWTAQVGTTATFTNSNMLVGMTGADLGILVTEVGAMYAPDAPSQGAANTVARWGNVCTAGGTDLPLGGFLGLASRQGCRATTTSWGYVLLGQLQYNSVFGTAISLQPTVAWNHGVQGNSPAPLANYRQGAKSVSLQLNGNYLGNWRGGIAYTNFFGNEKYVGNTDMDFVSANISYAF